jgi:hypothetical protein
MSKTKVPKIKPVEGYSNMTNSEVVNRASAVYTGLNGNPNFTNLPVALPDLKAEIDSVTALMAQAIDGSRKIIAETKKQVRVLIKTMRALGRYVELNCKDDESIFRSSGFEAVSTTKAPPAALTEKVRSVAHGKVSGEIVVTLKAVAKAGSYEFHYGASANGGLPTNWTTKSITSVKTPIVLDGLTPGTIYAFQARALVGNQFTDWSDPVTFMCT